VFLLQSLHSRPRERCGTKDRASCSDASISCTSARVRSLATLDRARASHLTPRPQRQDRPGGFRVESMSRASSAGSQPPRCSESNAVVSSPSSHSAGLASPGYPSRAPANHSRTQLGGALESERRPTARPVADWAVYLSGLGGEGLRRREGRPRPRVQRRGERGCSMATRAGDWERGVLLGANVLQRADQRNRHRFRRRLRTRSSLLLA